MSDAELTPADCAAIHWDVVVVGTGMGGATLGYELARMVTPVLEKVLQRNMLAAQAEWF